METIGNSLHYLNPTYGSTGSVTSRGEAKRADRGLIRSSAVLTDTIRERTHRSVGRFGPMPRHKPDSRPD
jgi:hypothetical protein